MKLITPPLKSQGIKTKLIPWIRAILPHYSGKWIEPFLGTGVVAFNIAQEKAILNDINPHIIHFYEEMKKDSLTPQSVKAFLQKEGENLSMANDEGYDHYRFVKNRFNNEHSPLDFLFLSRTAFNGMMRFNKKGEWNIPFCKKPGRFSQSYITKIVNQFINVRRKISKEWYFYNDSFASIIPMAEENDLIYCDPPYYGRYVDYYNGWTEDDERHLFEQLSETNARFILSTWHHNDFRHNEMIDKYWSRFNIITRDHFYHSGGKLENRKRIVEALVCNFDIDKSIKSHNHEAEIKHVQKELF